MEKFLAAHGVWIWAFGAVITATAVLLWAIKDFRRKAFEYLNSGEAGRAIFDDPRASWWELKAWFLALVLGVLWPIVLCCYLVFFAVWPFGWALRAASGVPAKSKEESTDCQPENDS